LSDSSVNGSGMWMQGQNIGVWRERRFHVYFNHMAILVSF